MNYPLFLSELDKRLSKYFDAHREYTCCEEGCSLCCEKGDYPLSSLELEYLMQGFISISDNLKRQVQINIKNMKKGGACPFLIDKKCSVYPDRPIMCRVHGLAYLCKEKTVKVPFCVHENKNYAKVYNDGMIDIAPIAENLDTISILNNYEFGEIRNLADWIKK